MITYQKSPPIPPSGAAPVILENSHLFKHILVTSNAYFDTAMHLRMRITNIFREKLSNMFLKIGIRYSFHKIH